MVEQKPPSGEPASGGSSSSGLSRVPARAWIALVLLILVIIFIFQNRQTAVVNMLMISVSAPMWITLAGCVLLGLLIGWLAGGRK